LKSVISKKVSIILLIGSILFFIPNTVLALPYSRNTSLVDFEGSGAQIRNIEFTDPIPMGSLFTINVTVQNYECGLLGADLVVILKQNGLEFSRQNAYVFRYLRQRNPFIFSFTASESPETMDISVELYWNNRDSMEMQDSRKIQLHIIAIEPTTTPTPTPTPTSAPTPTPTPTNKPTITPSPTPKPTSIPTPTPIMDLQFSIMPKIVTVTPNKKAFFTASVSGGIAPYSYQWYETGVRAIDSARSAEFSISKSKVGSYYYYCKITDSQGWNVDTDSVELNVIDNPTPPPNLVSSFTLKYTSVGILIILGSVIVVFVVKRQ